jgi:hypothetical protein
MEGCILDMRTALANMLLVIDEAWLDHGNAIAACHYILPEESDLEKFLFSSEVLLKGIHKAIERTSTDRQTIKPAGGLD